MGVTPIAWSEIEAFDRLNGLSMTPYEAGCIRSIDEVILDELSKPELSVSATPEQIRDSFRAAMKGAPSR